MDFHSSLNRNDRRCVVCLAGTTFMVPALRSLPPLARSSVQRTTSLLRSSLESVLAQRKDRLWLSLVAVPLALTAAMLAGAFTLVIPLTLLAAWWGSQEWLLAWLVGIMEACFGIQWGYVGAYALATYPQDRPLVAGLWIAYAALVAAVGAVNRWRYNRKYGW